MTKSKVSDGKKPTKPEPHNFEKIRIEKATAFAHAKVDAGQMPPRIEYAGLDENKVLQTEAPHSDKVGNLFAMHHAFGTGSHDFQAHQTGRLMAVMRSRGEEIPTEHSTNAGIAAVAAVEPQNEIEAMLAVQMAGTHEVAMEMLTRAKLANDTDQLERYGTLATKLLRTYTTQLEALAKMRRGGSQKVTVEHVYVHEGGQAIVGNVTSQGNPAPGGGRGQQEKEHQPHASDDVRALALAGDAAVWSADPLGDALRGACSEREDAMPDARRSGWKRRAEG